MRGEVLGAQAYTNSASLGLYTTQASWLATLLCWKFEAEAEAAQTFPNRGKWGYDWTGDVRPATVMRCHVNTPLKYAHWLRQIDPRDWQDSRTEDVYSREDFISARRFIARCARRGVGFRLSY